MTDDRQRQRLIGQWRAQDTALTQGAASPPGVAEVGCTMLRPRLMSLRVRGRKGEEVEREKREKRERSQRVLKSHQPKSAALPRQRRPPIAAPSCTRRARSRESTGALAAQAETHRARGGACKRTAAGCACATSVGVLFYRIQSHPELRPFPPRCRQGARFSAGAFAQVVLGPRRGPCVGQRRAGRSSPAHYHFPHRLTHTLSLFAFAQRFAPHLSPSLSLSPASFLPAPALPLPLAPPSRPQP